ncbi:hypothetical protein BDZ91DRAFT_36422 [Kalaharituber pfeilii]|nr:hypothetical protein BDZ91DRAFT_36422 [Kalaharituber pfeilii]
MLTCCRVLAKLVYLDTEMKKEMSSMVKAEADVLRNEIKDFKSEVLLELQKMETMVLITMARFEDVIGVLWRFVVRLRLPYRRTPLFRQGIILWRTPQRGV